MGALIPVDPIAQTESDYPSQGLLICKEGDNLASHSTDVLNSFLRTLI